MPVPSSPPKVFLSYSHTDTKWMKQVETSLKPLGLQRNIDYWVDTKIKTGEDWYEEIGQAIAEADIAILLLSRDFLASSFIANEEIPALLKQHQQQGMKIFSLLARPCPWESVYELRHLQIWRYQDKALSELRGESKRDSALSLLTTDLKELIEQPSQRTSELTVQAETADLPANITSDIDISRLPVTGKELFGRKTELEQLDKAWADQGTHIISLIAWGGVGKSTLMGKWLQYLAFDNYRGAQKVFAWSFYSQGTNEQVTSGEEFILTALEWFGDNNPQAGSAYERGQRLAKHIQQQQTLLLLDGLEPLQSGFDLDYGKVQDQGIAALLRNLALENPGLCVISSRVVVADIARYENKAQVMQLEKLSPDAGRALLRTGGVRANDDVLEKVVTEFGGHALAIGLLPGYLKAFTHHPAEAALAIPDLPQVSINAGKHPRRVIAALAEQLSEQSHSPRHKEQTVAAAARELLLLLGLFDRPAPHAALKALMAPPAITHLTEQLTEQAEAGLFRAIEKLRSLKLVATYSEHQADKIDCHPLVREHFAEELQDNSSALQAAHQRLYEYYQQLPEQQQPDTLTEMEPLFHAVRHGCLAGMAQQALDDVYWPRIQREGQYYLLRKLGAFGTNLACVASFFNQPWQQPDKGLTPEDKAAVLNWAASALRALGRLTEAQQPFQAGLALRVEQQNWKNAAKDAGSLSELNLTLGQVPMAVEYGQQSVEYADKSGNDFQMESKRTTHGDTLLQQGQWQAAYELFADAEQRQQQRQPEYHYLYSVQGFRYCDYWLTQGAVENVLQRVHSLFTWRIPTDSLLGIALEDLTAGNATYAQALAEHHSEKLSKAKTLINQAVASLRKAGQLQYIIIGPLARSQLYIDLAASFTGNTEEHLNAAWQDLNEVDEIATSGNMTLFLVDYHLSTCRLLYAQCALQPDLAHWEIWQHGEALSCNQVEMHIQFYQHRDKAEKLIETTGYLRRSAELQQLKQVDITHPDFSQQPRPDWLPPFVNQQE